MPLPTIFLDISGSESWVENDTIRRAGSFLSVAAVIVHDQYEPWLNWKRRHRDELGGHFHANKESNEKLSQLLSLLPWDAGCVLLVHRPSAQADANVVAEAEGNYNALTDGLIFAALGAPIATALQLAHLSINADPVAAVNEIVINRLAGGQPNENNVREWIRCRYKIPVRFQPGGDPGVDLSDLVGSAFRRRAMGKKTMPWPETERWPGLVVAGLASVTSRRVSCPTGSTLDRWISSTKPA